MNSTKNVPDLQQTRSKRDLGRQCGEMGGASEMLIVLERECLDLSEAIEQ